MGKLVDGIWEISPIAQRDKKGNFVRPDSKFRNNITQTGKEGFKAEPNRYHIYISYACPWASRVLIFLILKQLDKIISYSVVDPIMLDMGWEFSGNQGKKGDPINHKRYLYEIYQMADPHYTGKVTVPVLWDKHKKTMVNNESADIIRMLNSEFNEFTDNKYDYYPEEFREEIDKINDFIYHNINNGVYKCGFASTQKAYDKAFDALFYALEVLEQQLQDRQYLIDDRLTEADWRLFTTLIRFDVVYYLHFKCNLKQIAAYPNLSRYLHHLYEIPGISQTVNFYHIKKHYYISHKFLNPKGIVPKGPELHFNEEDI